MKTYDNPEKDKYRDYLIQRFVKPKKDCEKPGAGCFRILDFYGGGLFLHKLVDYFQVKNVRNHPYFEIYEIEKDKDLQPYLLKDSEDINHTSLVNNHRRTVFPFCSSLADFITALMCKTRLIFNLIWLDYCGSIGKEEIADIKLLSNIVDENSIIAITFWRSKDQFQNIYEDGNISRVVKAMAEVLPYFELEDKIIRYGKMVNVIFKVPSYIKSKLRKEVNNGLQESYPRPTIDNLGVFGQRDTKIKGNSKRIRFKNNASRRSQSVANYG